MVHDAAQQKDRKCMREIPSEPEFELLERCGLARSSRSMERSARWSGEDDIGIKVAMASHDDPNMMYRLGVEDIWRMHCKNLCSTPCVLPAAEWMNVSTKSQFVE